MLLTNWLRALSSRLKRRSIFRSRDRRAIRQRWQTATSNRISTAEILEDRTLLTALVNGTNRDDVLTINATGVDSGTYQLNGGPVVNFSAITDFTFNGFRGDDTLIINNPVGSLFNPANGITFNGGTGADFGPGDTFQILGGTASLVEHVFASDSKGSIFYEEGLTAAFTYTGTDFSLQPSIDTITAADRIFSFMGADETITVSDSAIAGQTRINSTLGEFVSFLNPTGLLEINTEGLTVTGDAININGVDAAFDADIIVNGNSTDTITMQSIGIGSGALDIISADEVNIEGTFSTTGSVEITANSHISMAGVGSIDAGGSDIDLIAGTGVALGLVSTTGDVRVTALTGQISDSNALANNITANQVALRAGTAIGTLGNTIETQISTLAATTSNGLIRIENKGDLAIGMVDSLNGITASDLVEVSTTKSMAVNSPVLAGSINLVVDDDSATTGEDISIFADLTSNSSFINLLAADDVTISSGATINAATSATFEIDSGDADDAGGLANLNGAILATAGITVIGQGDDDQVKIDSTGGDLNNGGTIDGIQGAFTFDGLGGIDSLFIDDSGDVTGDLMEITNVGSGEGLVRGASAFDFAFGGVESLTVYGGTGADEFTVAPNLGTAINITGGRHDDLTTDILTYLLPTGEDPTLTPSGSEGGTILISGGFENIVFDEIENSSIDVIIEGTSGDDVLKITPTGASSGTYQLNDGSIIDFSDIIDLTFNGLDGDDTLVLNNPDGSLFAPPNGIIFNGGTGGEVVGDTLEILGGTAITVEHRFVSDSDGIIFYNNEITPTITYTGLEPVIDTITATDRIFSFTGASETVTLSDDGDVGDNESQIDSTLGESVTFLNPTGSLTILNLNNAAHDAYNAQGLDSLFDADLTFDTNSIDTVNFQTNATDLGSGDLFVNTGHIMLDQDVSTTGNVTLNAIRSSILDGGTNDSDSLTAASATLFAEENIGDDGVFYLDLDLDIDRLEASTNTGRIYLSNNGSLTIDGNGVQAQEEIILTVSGGITIVDGASITAIDDDVSLIANDDINLGEVSAAGDLVRITSTNGRITDSTGSSLITADRAVLRANLGIGNSGTSINTDVNTLAASGTSQTVNLLNSGDLIIGMVDGLSGVTAAESVILETSRSMVIGDPISGGTVRLVVSDSAIQGDDLRIVANVTSLIGMIELNSGDDFYLSTGAILDAASTLNINIDHGGTVDGVGAVANLNGTLMAGTGSINVFGGDDSDIFVIDSNGGSHNDGGTVDGILSPLVFLGSDSNDFASSGNDQLIIDDSGDTTGDTIAITNTSLSSGTVTGAGLVDLGFNLVENLTVYTGTDADDITVSPNLGTRINLVGGDPGVSPGDTLTYITPSEETQVLTPDGADGGTISVTGGFEDVVFDEIETVNSLTELVINGTPGNDVLTINATGPNTGTYEFQGFVISLGNLSSLTFNGLEGDDTLVINNPTGALFDPINGITFNGGTGGETNGDRIRIMDGMATTVEHVFVNDSDGSVFYDGEGAATITYTGLEPVIDTITATDRIFSFTGADETITLSNNGQFGDGVSHIDSTLAESVSFANPTGTLTINTEVSGGSGADTININDVDSTFDANLTVNAGNDDTITTGAVDIGSGTLNLIANQVNINETLSTIGVVNIDATSDISMSATGIINASASDIELTAGTDVHLGSVTTTGEVRVTATTGSITDNNGGATNITANQAALRAGRNVENLNTTVHTVAGASTTGFWQITNTGALIIGSVDNLNGATAADSAVLIETSGALTVNSPISAGLVTLRTTDSLATGEDITINADVTDSIGMDMGLFAADNLTVATGVIVSSASGIDIEIDSGNADAGVGGTANLNGTLIANSTISITGDTDADTVIIDDNSGTTNDGGTVDGIQAASTLTFTGGGGADELILDDSGDATGDTIAITNTGVGEGAVTEVGLADLGFEDLENLTVNTGTDADDITVAPNEGTAINIVGGDPATSPGDTLTFNTPSGETPALTPDGADGGTISVTGGFADVVFDEIESTDIPGLPAVTSITVNGTVGNDVLTITATSTNSGTYQLNGGSVINFTDITDFTFNGLDGDDTLVINNPAGALFDPADGITFDGGDGSDTLEILGGSATTVDHRFISESDGTIFYNGEITATITYTGLEPITDTITATDRIFSFTGAGERVTLSDDGDVGDNESLIDSTRGESVTFVNPTDSLTISNLNNAVSDTYNAEGLDSMFDADLTFNTIGNDEVIFQTNATDLGSGDLFVRAGEIVLDQDVSTTGNVTLNAINGSIVDGETSDSDSLTAASAILFADSDIGENVALDIDVDSLEASTNHGPILLSNNGSLIINGNGVQAESEIILTASGGITIVDGVSITSTNADIELTANDDINLGTIIAGTSSVVRITSTTGMINDNTAAESFLSPLITARQAALQANLGIGAGDNINTEVLEIAAASTNGTVNISNTGTLDIQQVGDLIGVTASGDVILETSRFMDVSRAISGGTVTLAITDSPVAFDDLDIKANVTSTIGAIEFNVGDELLIDPTAFITAANGTGTININLDQGTADVGTGSNLNLSQVLLSAAQVNITGGADDDDIRVSPRLNTAFNILGGDPAVAPGDTLTYLTPSGEAATLTPVGADGGIIGATGGFADVFFDEIEAMSLSGSVTVNGTTGDDVLTITATDANSGSYQLTSGGVPGPVINFTDITEFTFNGSEGDDTLVINNPVGGLFDPVNGINFDGGAGGEFVGDTLEIIGGTATTVEHQFINISDGSIFYNTEGTATINYTGLEPVIDTITATDRVFTFTGTDETITLSDDSDVGDGESQIDSTLGESVTFAHPVSSLIINAEISGGSGLDAVNVEGLDDTFDIDLTINAGIDDTVSFQTNATDLGSGALLVDSGNIVLDQDVSTTGTVFLNATNGSITDGGTSFVDSLSAASAILSATDSVGAFSALDISVTNLEAMALTGEISLSNSSVTPLNIGGVSGFVGLQAETGINLTADTNLQINEDLTSNTGPVVIFSSADITMANGTTITAAGGDIELTSDTNIALSLLSTAGNVEVSAFSGSISDNNGVSNNITALEAQLTGNEVGTDLDALETNISVLSGTSNTGGFYLDNTGALSLATAGNDLTAATDMRITSTGSIDANEIVSAASGDLELINTAGNFLLNASSDLIGNSITINSAGNATFVDSSAVLVGGIGAINIQAVDDIALSELSTSGDVNITSTTGEITDNTAAETPNISADGAALRAATGIGDGDEIDTAVNTLAADTPVGNIEVSNTGGLTIGTVVGLVGVLANSGAVNIAATSPMTVASDVTASGVVSLTAGDSAVAGDDLTINAGVTVHSTGASVALSAGDDFLLTLGAEVITNTTIEINVDPSAGDPDGGTGATVDLLGNVNATQTTINGGDDSDIFNILPTQDSPITINGGDPTVLGSGDVLNMDFSGLTSPPILTLGGTGSGTFSFSAPDTELPVTYNSIENLNSGGIPYHLVLDMAAAGFQDGAADTIDAELDGTGTNFLIAVNGGTGSFFNGPVADILSFTVIGSTDNETLNINESAGGLPLFTAAAPAVSGSAGSHLNTAADTFLEDQFNPTTYDADDITLHYDGGDGNDAINVNFTTVHDAAYFADNLGGLGSGNIVSSSSGASDIDLGLSFGNLEGVGIFVLGGGILRVDASSTPLTTTMMIDDDGTPDDGVSSISANGGFTNMLFGGFDSLDVVSGTGAELIDLIGFDSLAALFNVELDADDVFAANDVANDTIRVRSTSAGVMNINILAGLGDDLIQIFDDGNSVDGIFANITVDGEDGIPGVDTLTIVGSGDIVSDNITVTSTTVDGITNATGTDVTFANIDSLNVTGTGGNDTINVNLTTQEDLNNVNLNGFNGDDDFNLQNSTPAGVDTRLNGDAGADEFRFQFTSVLNGFIDGGDDFDLLDYSPYDNAVHVALSGLGTIDGFQGRENNGSILGTGIAGLGFDNIDDLGGSFGDDILEGPNLNNYWGITSTNAGFLIADRPNLMSGRPTTAGNTIATPPEQFMDFTDFENLIGGNQDDRFDLSDVAGLTGTLDGRLGNDSLDYYDYGNGINVDLFAGTATNIGGGLVAGTGGGDDDNSIENVFGGNGNDNITGDNDDNILGDGFGSDNLDGGGNGVGSENGGNDVFLMEPGAGGSADVITDIHGNDTIDFRFASQGIVFDVDIINTPQDVFGGNTIELRQIQPQQPDTNPSFMENIVGSEFNDIIFIDPLSQDGNFPIDGPPVLRSADGRGGIDVLDFDAKGQEVIDTGFSLTADGVGTVQYLNFENVRPFEDTPAFIVDDGDLGFSLGGDWPFHPGGTAAITNGIGFGDDVHSVREESPIGNGPAQAFWEFYGLTPGDYRISVTWPVSTNPTVVGQAATDAPYTIFDGARTDIGTAAVDLGTIDLNQQLEPDDFTADGTVWENLGVFTINSRTLTVMLTNLANGRITADAIRIERVSAGPEIELRDITDAPVPPTIIMDGHQGGINFGATELLTDAVRTFEITNQGSAPLNISNIVVPPGFTTNLVDQAIAPGNTIQFTLTMDSNTFGDRSGIFSFTTDDVDEETFNILLQGSVSNVIIIDDGDADFSATAGFVSFPDAVNNGAGGFEGDVSGAVPNQPGSTPQPGAETATWTFTGLADGNYRVSTTWSTTPTATNRVDDAPFTLNGGGPIDVDQTVAPSSFTDLNGVQWFDLDASFSVIGGTLTVELTNDANSFPRDHFTLSNGVIADAVRIEYLPEPDIQVTVDGDVVEDDTGVVDFGSTLPGIPVIRTFTVTNLSADPVDVTGLIEFPPGFSIDPTSPFGTDTTPVTINGGSSVTFTIQFDGGTTGSTFGQISFTTGDEDENPYNFTVMGEAGPSTVGVNDTDFSTVGTWNELETGSQLDPEFLYAGDFFQGGTGANAATWTFDVEPGRYQVVANWYVNPNITTNGVGAASNAPYTIFDNGATVTTIAVDQRTSSDDFLDDGILWEFIGDPVQITSNTLSVQLSDNADGIVYADQVRIYRVVDPVIVVEVGSGLDTREVTDGGAVDFEETIVGAPVIRTFTITNFGERDMALGPISIPAGFSMVAPPGNTNLPPGASTTFSLQMDAATAGSFSGMVSFGVDSTDANPFNFMVSGSASASMIVDNGDLDYTNNGPWETRTAQVAYIDYFQDDQDLLIGGDLPGVNTATWQFTNLGAGTYQVASHWFQHSNLAPNAEITISGIVGGPITVSLDQRFAPNDFSADGTNWEELGHFQVAAGGTLTVTMSDDGATGHLAADAMRLELIPVGLTAPEIEVRAGATNLTSGASSVDLGTSNFGGSLFQIFTITNTGTATLNLGAITPPAGFVVSTALGTTALAAGQSTTFELEFNGATSTAGVLTIANDDADENPFSFTVSATAVNSLIIDDGDAGFTSGGDYFASGAVAYRGFDSQKLNIGQTGTASWNFTGLVAGTYQVSATWDGHPLRDTGVDYDVTSSGVGGGAIAINQRIDPNDFNAEGSNWEILGTVTIGAGGSITVTLNDTAVDGSILADAIRIERTGPLQATSSVANSGAPVLTQADLNSVRDAALSYWTAAGISAAELERLQSISFVLADLPDTMLGGATSTTIMIDINAAGHGWFVDETPFDHSEFTEDADGGLSANEESDAFGRMDLLTVVLHEFGHTLGYADLDAEEAGHDLMSESLGESLRRLPVIEEAADTSDVDDFFSSIVDGDNPLLD